MSMQTWANDELLMWRLEMQYINDQMWGELNIKTGSTQSLISVL